MGGMGRSIGTFGAAIAMSIVMCYVTLRRNTRPHATQEYRLMDPLEEKLEGRGDHESTILDFAEPGVVMKLRKCARETGGGGNRVLLRFSMECVATELSTDDPILPVMAKYAVLLDRVQQGKAVLSLGSNVRLLVSDSEALKYPVGDMDLELKSSSCSHNDQSQSIASRVWYHITAAQQQTDFYNGYWEVLGLNAWICNVPWYWISSGFDPQVVFLSPTAPTEAFLKEMLTRLSRGYGQPKGSPEREEVSETYLFNQLTVYREDKYLTVRRFDSGYWWSDLCTSYLPDPSKVPAVGRIRHPSFEHAASRAWDTSRHIPYPHPLHTKYPRQDKEPAEVVDPGSIPCTKEEGDSLCKAAWLVSIDIKGTPSVGIAILKGPFLTTMEPRMAKLPRSDVPKHTLCACLDQEGCKGCRLMGATPFEIGEYLNVPGAGGKGMINIYKYYIALQLIRRGFGVMSYDVDIVFLRSPWNHFEDPRFDLFISTDGHHPSYQSDGVHYHGSAYVRSSVNTGLWYLRPTPGGRNLFHRVTGFFNATSEHKTEFFFEQAMVHTVIFQTASWGKWIAGGDARVRLLSTLLFMNSKTVQQVEGDDLTLCKAVSAHANYGCPFTTIHKSDKGTWLSHIATVCRRYLDDGSGGSSSHEVELERGDGGKEGGISRLGRSLKRIVLKKLSW